jgi:hypothetical protein
MATNLLHNCVLFALHSTVLAMHGGYVLYDAACKARQQMT